MRNVFLLTLIVLRYQQTISRAVGRLEPTTMVFDPMPDSTIPVMIAFYQVYRSSHIRDVCVMTYWY